MCSGAKRVDGTSGLVVMGLALVTGWPVCVSADPVPVDDLALLMYLADMVETPDGLKDYMAVQTEGATSAERQPSTDDELKPGPENERQAQSEVAE